ncbi:class II fructose-bisphosphatase [Vibrio europaeus]|uniref:class II fructose-bisphosphatase n=1 Tax=Vibrio europaeus TaxID=300876 RepID=UPI00234027F0|nr:class II fructose-bisphosphatase [Vibrio europaeus]MDC5849954.1 class II fructose-bisphosphatase [Vibrio europaeus]
MMNELGLTLTEVTEKAALAGYQWLGRGDKENADKAAVDAMRRQLNQSKISAKIVIGEGEIDDAPMLYIGEELGLGGAEIDIAVDPIEGTRMTAMGQANALAVLAAAEKGTLLQAPDMYMEKLVVGPKAASAINLELSIKENVLNIAKALNKPLDKLVLATLAKQRHEKVIQQLQNLGVKVYAFPDGDVAASLLTCLPESDVDAMYCIGGAPEGVVSAAVIRAMSGNMQARLLLREQVKGRTDANVKISAQESLRCQQMGVEHNRVLKLNQLAKSANIVFCATGITKGDVLAGVQKHGSNLTTETLLVQGASKTIRMVKSIHDISVNSEQQRLTEQ